jgi:hypothetical protein
VKWGQTTGYTAATFSCIKSHVKLPGNEGTYTEWCFVGKDERDFSRRGDSGPLVQSETGELAGIIVGGSFHEPGGFILTCVTPEVFGDISRRLGCSVHLSEAVTY